jgi:hypothetical protein
MVGGGKVSIEDCGGDVVLKKGKAWTAAVAAAQTADQVVLVLGCSTKACGHEGTDRKDTNLPGDQVRCAFSDRNLHSRMPLDPTHVHLKRTYMRVTNGIPLGYPLLLPVGTVNRVQIRKGSFALEVLALGKPTVVVLINGGIISIDSLIPKAAAIVEAFYPSIRGAEALAMQLLGKENRCERLASIV